MLPSSVRPCLVAVVAALVVGGGVSPAAAQNRLSNPGFDGNATGWFLFGSAYDGAVDIANFASSGSVRTTVNIPTVGNTVGIAEQCIFPVVPGAPITFSANVRFDAPGTPNPGSGAGLIAFTATSDAGCTAAIGPVTQSTFAPQTNGTWQTNSISGTVPVGAQAVSVAVAVVATTTAGDFLVHADNFDAETAGAVPTMSAVWLTLLTVGCALVVLVMQRRRAVAR